MTCQKKKSLYGDILNSNFIFWIMFMVSIKYIPFIFTKNIQNIIYFISIYYFKKIKLGIKIGI